MAWHLKRVSHGRLSNSFMRTLLSITTARQVAGHHLNHSKQIGDMASHIEPINVHEAVLHFVSDVVVLYDSENRVTFWNKAAEKLFGWNDREVLGKNLLEIIVPERMRRRGKSSLDDIYTGSIIQTIVQCINGEEKAVEIFLRRVILPSVEPGSYQVCAYIKELNERSVQNDTTDREKHPTEEMAIRWLLDASGYMVMIKTVDSVYEEINAPASQFLEKATSDFVGKNDHELFPVHVADLFRAAEMKAMTSPNGIQVEETFTMNGYERTALVTRAARRNSDGVLTGVYTVAQDITNYKAAMIQVNNVGQQKALESSRQKSEVLANMSHEIRTPINGMLGLTFLILDSNLEREQMEYVMGIQRSAKSLLTIINDILDISKIEAGKVELEILDTDIATLLQDVMFMLQQVQQVENKDLDVRLFNKIPEEKRYIRCDPSRWKQILVNLVGNALKFTKQGLVHVTAEYLETIEVVTLIDLAIRDTRTRAVTEATSQRLQMNSVLKVTVQDTGVGIKESQRDALFTPFAQASLETTRKYGGTGLGLSITKQLLQLMNGQIDYTSDFGKGSTFWFQVPFVPGNADKCKEQVRREVHTIKKSAMPTDRIVMVVDDNNINLTVAEKLLQRMGYKTRTFVNGKLALEAIATDSMSFGMIFMDCQMPVMDGYEATKRIRALPMPANRIPIVAMTANAFQGERERCMDIGMNDYISKPFDKDEFQGCVVQWMLGTDD